MSLNESQFKALPIDEMWSLYAAARVDKTSFDQVLEALRGMTEALSACQTRVDELEGQIEVNKNVNGTLNECVFKLQRQVHRLEQYSRRENVILSGVPEGTEVSALEHKAIRHFIKIGANITAGDISACHRMKKKSNVIVRFVNRKSVDLVLGKSKLAQNLDTSDVWGAPEPVALYPNLSPHYLAMRYKARKLKEHHLIAEFGFGRAGLWVKGDPESNKKPVDLDADLYEFLPEGQTLTSLIE